MTRVVYSHAIEQQYYTTGHWLFNRATIFQALSLIVAIAVPYLITYASGDMWLKQSTYWEQPRISYNYKYLMVLSDEDGLILVCSTYKLLNDLVNDRYRPCSVSSQLINVDSDNLPDRLRIIAKMPIENTENVRQVRAIFELDVHLQLHSLLAMQAGIIVDKESLSPAAQLSVNGDLGIKQRKPLLPYGRDNFLSTSAVVDDADLTAGTNVWSRIINRYAVRNISTTLMNTVTVWRRAADARSFTLDIDVRVNAVELQYYTGWWLMLKYAWIQYLSILIIFLFLAMRIRATVFRNRLVPVVPMPVQVHCRHAADVNGRVYTNDALD